MKKWKKLNIVLLCVLLLAVLTLQAFAAGTIDVKKDAELDIVYLYDGEPIYGAEFAFFRIADTDAYSKLTAVKRFREYDFELDDNTVESWNEMAELLEGYVGAAELEPDEIGATDREGKLSVKGLKPGLYLVLSKKCVNGNFVYTAAPSLVMLPGLDEKENVWKYEVTIYPKPEREGLIIGKTTECIVTKVWDDKEYSIKRPSYITVRLLRDGKLYDTKRLDAKSGWTYHWKELDYADKDGVPYRWTVSEDPVEYYKTSIKLKGVTFVVTNSLENIPPDEPPHEPPDLPKTGVLWWPVPVLLCVGAMFLIVGAVRRKEDAE